MGRKREREEDVEDVEESNIISQYELQRLERIKRNNAFMASLSLGSPNKVCGISGYSHWLVIFEFNFLN